MNSGKRWTRRSLTAIRLSIAAMASRRCKPLGNKNRKIIILDLMLTELDGVSLLHEIRDAGIYPMVLAVTRFYNDYIQETAQDLGIGYIIRKPCDPAAVAGRLRDLTNRIKPKAVRPVDPRNYVMEQTRMLMFSPRHQGTKFIQEAILIVLEEPGISLTKELYPRLGHRFGGTALQVEHSLRTAIVAACKKSTARCGMICSQPTPSPVIGKSATAW